MRWNWELPDWPKFTYHPHLLAEKEKQFLLATGSSSAFLKSIKEKDYRHFVVEILSTEGLESSRIEGEFLDRESLQSSIKKHFGIQASDRKGFHRESGMADSLFSVYESFREPLTHEMLWKWHAFLFNGQNTFEKGTYRTHAEPMQIVSSRLDHRKVFFEAPHSDRVYHEMDAFIEWFNHSTHESILGRAAIAHVYFESIHPFEDGNGRIGRMLIEKILSQGVRQPVLVAVSKILEQRKKEYYAALERCNRTLEVTHWVDFFSDAVLQAQQESTDLLYFLVEKSKMLTSLAGNLNGRQEKALLRLFNEGPRGFQGGLSAEKYIAITKASKATATRDLADLVQKGALKKTGELKHTRYWLNIQTHKCL